MIAHVFDSDNIIRKLLALIALTLLSSGSAVFAALFASIAVVTFSDNMIFAVLNVGASCIFSSFVLGAWAGIMYIKARW